MGKTEPVILSSKECQTLKTWANARSMPIRLIQRAQIKMAAVGISIQDTAKKLNISRPTVQLCRARFLSLRLLGLKKDALRTGRIPKISKAKV